ncbi:Festuclavine dehydrogenase subunit FgaOx3 OS=Neosartorya fumigata (strain ATCC MYA-4609 / Af293 / CBS 101355 / FGSC A1100) GN=fgaOx3 PE=3 SV=1 [Rhizoctonia solani AG-1 IB]|uniref:Festuclavine dehydrogenase subunit FgaOx3 n=1 Tax=Thanatephorus cucumeris (strain AG1-IB / isolate 7/3/14) TaxID=1108050 RepID=A0A0B7FF00_THACB|nr:Festuclavine dehydrogenase subunit FgaOx3 OS=Neosartorya fumigata (strain ATCC MYA-4609 / Af293 / CBS 101355 / FGSC A1100) GN=fgaOx3 PE=3 SV=1 [Rhizoctonia solani AG-1 IB]
MSSLSNKLFTPLKLGSITLSHRVVMAPLTRYRANDGHAHTELGVQYYAQRAEVPGTLLVTEGTLISPEAGGYDRVPGIWSDEQIAAWKKVTDAVHERHSYIYLQLWALGRAADPNVLVREGLPFVSASPIPIEEGGPVPSALSEEEIKRYIEQYVQAAKNAVFRAGFDGVELHSANGYLLDQFLQDNSNKRTDRYGGSVENRGRFVLEVVKAVATAVGENKTAIRFSPWTRFQGMRMQDPIPTFSYVIKELSEKHSDLAYVHFVEPILEEAPTQDIQTLKVRN